MNKLFFLVLFLFSVILPPSAFAAEDAYVSIVNPVRGEDFWEEQNQNPQTAVSGQVEILRKNELPATWLVRYDALNNSQILDILENNPNYEKGLFLEVTPTWTGDANVEYNKGDSWHTAGSAFLTGYEKKDREKLIDTAFLKFKELFGFYPKSVGAWWIDSYSLQYMQDHYGILGSLVVADQYTTDNYQVWGQYWSTPYYPSKKDALNPAQSKDDKLPVVIMQWASRDPVNGYGNSVLESTFSVQANDYMDYHGLGTSYFSKLVDIYTLQPLNQFSHLVVGLENSYSWNRYKNEYENQIKTLVEKSKKGQFTFTTMKGFAQWYKDRFPSVSPPQVISTDDPLGSAKKSVWFMNPYYRIGWFYNQEGSVIRDIRQYVSGEEEICYLKSCNELNFATFATRVLDDVTYHKKWVIDEGKIRNFKLNKDQDRFILSYTSEVDKARQISFLPRDLEVNGKISSIDGAILDAQVKDKLQDNLKLKNSGFGKINFSILTKLIDFLGFIIFVFLVIFLPGYFIAEKLSEAVETVKRIFLSVVIGLVLLTVLFYLLSIFNLKSLLIIYPLFGIILTFLKREMILKIFKMRRFNFDPKKLPIVGIIVLGMVFQVIPVIKSGLKFDFGIGFWGPNTHDGIWHIALINQLIKNTPPENPIFAQSILKNYHYFYDLLIAATGFLTRIDISDLVFRFYPLLFSLLLGIGSYYLCLYILQGNKAGKHWAPAISLYLVYFSGSLGWIVEYIAQKQLGGESAFWANQAVSFNLNPPFAISLVIMVGIMLIMTLSRLSFTAILIVSFLAGTLIGFKAYAAIVVILGLLLTGFFTFLLKRQIRLILVSALSLALSGFYMLMNGLNYSNTIFQFSPLWFINSMIDSPDRVGWSRLSLARYYSLERKEWFKFIGVEVVGLTIFLVGNLNLRIVGLLKILNFDRMKKETAYLFIASLSLVTLFAPLLFIQSGTPWNTIQFFYYFIYLCAVFSGPALISLFTASPKLITIPVFILLLLAPINSISTARGYFTPSPHGRISNLELAGLEFLSEQPDGTVLTYPYDKKLKSQYLEPWPIFIYDTTSYVSAFTKKAVFIEDESQNDILLTDYKKRLIAQKDFFMDPTNSFLKNNEIKYIYIPKIIKFSLDQSGLPIKRIFENDEVTIYKVN